MTNKDKEFIEFMQSISPKYTADMYLGNVPCGKGHKLVSGEYTDRWACKYGGGETNGDNILDFAFNINPKVTIFILEDKIDIVDHRYSDKFDEWVYCNHPERGVVHGCLKQHLHELEEDRIEKYLNTKILDCKIWDMVQKRAKELCNI